MKRLFPLGFRFVIAFVGLFLLGSFIRQFRSSNPSLFKITIERKVKGQNCTQGYLLINDSVVAYTLELPDKNNEQYISSIPKATYDGIIRTDGTKGWRLELDGVPQRQNIQIHLGSYTRQTVGCILVGKSVDLTNCSVGDPSNQRQGIDLVERLLNKFTVDLILNNPNPKPVNIQVEITGI